MKKKIFLVALLLILLPMLTRSQRIRPKIEANIQTIEYFAKKTLGWRTSTKRYNSIYERFMSQGSCNFDKVIVELYNSGYGI